MCCVMPVGRLETSACFLLFSVVSTQRFMSYIVYLRYVKEMNVTRRTTKTFRLTQVLTPPQYVAVSTDITFHCLRINIKPTNICN